LARHKNADQAAVHYFCPFDKSFVSFSTKLLNYSILIFLKKSTNMKKLLFPSIALLLAAASLGGQTPAKRYVFIEHFTNTKCSICASRNPAFYNLINQAQYTDDIHHVSIHPSVPYNTCAFYLANPTENNAWAATYGIQGTPRIAINGSLQPGATQLLTAANLQNYLPLTSPLAVEVSEDGPASERSVSIQVKTVAPLPAGGNYKLYVALVEKTVAAPPPPNNGEQVHYDVFRKMLVNGVSITPAGTGQSLPFYYEYIVNANWDDDQVYALAFVRNTDTGEVLNSGTRFDATTSSSGAPAPQSVRIAPNPVTQKAFVALEDDQAQSVEIFASSGQRVSLSFDNQGNTLQISTATLARGIYFLKIMGEKGVYTGKFVKE
jgi:hypothetical protein